MHVASIFAPTANAAPPPTILATLLFAIITSIKKCVASLTATSSPRIFFPPSVIFNPLLPSISLSEKFLFTRSPDASPARTPSHSLTIASSCCKLFPPSKPKSAMLATQNVGRKKLTAFSPARPISTTSPIPFSSPLVPNPSTRQQTIHRLKLLHLPLLHLPL